jgi:hypothetical protein
MSLIYKNKKVMLIKKGDKGELVKQIQRILNLNPDGDFGDLTEKAVIKFQKSKGLNPDGQVGKITWEALGLDTDQTNAYKVPDTDNVLNYKGKYITANNLTIDKAYLDDNEYVTTYGKLELKGFFLHATAGWDNPYQTINSWNIDERGQIATQYCIGGSNIYGNSKYDGDVVECFPDGYLGWHLGGVGNNNIHIYSGGVELCNFGYLYEKDNKYYPYIAKKNGQWRTDYYKYEVKKEFVCDLGYEFRGFRFFHKYSDKQIENLRLLILHLKTIYPKMDLTNGLPKLLKGGVDPKIAFEFNLDAYNAKQFGLWTHTNVRKDKLDCHPQIELINMIKNL